MMTRTREQLKRIKHLLQKQNGILEQKIISLESDKKRLTALNDKYEDKIDELEEELEELRPMAGKNKNMAKLGGIAAIEGLIHLSSKSPIAAAVTGLLGIRNDNEDENEQEYPQSAQQQASHYQPAPQAIAITQEDEINNPIVTPIDNEDTNEATHLDDNE